MNKPEVKTVEHLIKRLIELSISTLRHCDCPECNGLATSFLNQALRAFPKDED